VANEAKQIAKTATKSFMLNNFLRKKIERIHSDSLEETTNV